MTDITLGNVSVYLHNAYMTELLHTVPVVTEDKKPWFKVVPPYTENSVQFTLVELLNNKDKVFAEVAKLQGVPDDFIELAVNFEGYGIKVVTEGYSEKDAEYLTAINALVTLFNVSVRNTQENNELYIDQEHLELMHTYMHYKGDCSLLQSEIEDAHACVNENVQSANASEQDYKAHTRKTNAEASVLMLDAYPQLKQTHTFDVDTGLLVEHTK